MTSMKSVSGHDKQKESTFPSQFLKTGMFIFPFTITHGDTFTKCFSVNLKLNLDKIN